MPVLGQTVSFQLGILSRALEVSLKFLISGSFIGSGCIIKQGIKIGEKVVVSAGEKIMNDIPSNTIYKNL